MYKVRYDVNEQSFEVYDGNGTKFLFKQQKKLITNGCSQAFYGDVIDCTNLPDQGGTNNGF